MEQVVILVIIGLISLVNWLIQRSAELREQRKLERNLQGIPEGNPFLPNDAPVAEPPRKDPAEEMRKLMEALGVDVEEGSPLREQPVLPPKIPPLPAFEPPLPLPKPKPPSAKRPVHKAAPLPAHPASALSATLRSRSSVRQAIILREILGPPKAFRL
jgi:hypothetical protein